jgi:hypothetical protein
LNIYTFIVGCVVVTGFPTLIFAQPTIRIDDHFQRNKRLIAIDLNEKANTFLIECGGNSGRFYDANHFFRYRCGVVSALLDAFLANRVPAFSPEDLQKNLTPQQFYKIITPLFAQFEEEDDEEQKELIAAEDEEVSNDFEESENEESEEYQDASAGKDSSSYRFLGYSKIDRPPFSLIQLKGLQTKLEIIEDVVFDAAKAANVFQPAYVILKWVNPYGVGVQLSLIAFKYADILTVLEQTQWKNRFNDASDKSIRQIFDLRLFNYIVLNYSGLSSKNLFLAEKFKEKIVTFEHNLWEY